MERRKQIRILFLGMIPTLFLALLLECPGQQCRADDQNSGCTIPLFGSWTINTDGRVGTKYPIFASSAAEYKVTNSNLRNPGGHWMGLFLIDAKGQSPQDLEEYYASHFPHDDWDLLRFKIASGYGLMPFAYLHIDEGTPALFDGARHWLGRKEAKLSIPGNFPCGTYILSSLTRKMVFKLTVRGEHCAHQNYCAVNMVY